MDFSFVLRRKFLIAWESVFDLRKDSIVKIFVFFINDFLVFFNYSFKGLIWNIKEFNEAFSTPKDLFSFGIGYKGVSSADIVAIEWVFGVDLIFLRASGCQAEVDDGEIFVFGVVIFDHFDGFLIFEYILVCIGGVGVDFFEWSNLSKLFFSFCSFDGVLSFFDLMFLIGFQLHICCGFFSIWVSILK